MSGIGARTTGRILVAAAVLWALPTGACGGDVPSSSGSAADVGVGSDVGSEDVDGGTASRQRPAGYRYCAAAGRSTGDEYELVQCTAPMTVGSAELRGEGVRLELRVTRVK